MVIDPSEKNIGLEGYGDDYSDGNVSLSCRIVGLKGFREYGC